MKKNIIASILVLVLIIASAAIAFAMSITGRVIEISPTGMVVSETTDYTTNCNDTDGGKNYNVKGECYSLGAYAPDICLADSQDPSVISLNEKYCGANGCTNEIYICPSNTVCEGGRCCIPEGGSIPVIDNAPDCCDGLSLIKPKDEITVGSFGICTAKCGNGFCDSATESAFNCPADCKETISCGNGIIEIGEECDSSNLNGRSCTYFPAYSGGTLKCSSDCKFDKSSCRLIECGNGVKEGTEQCDENDLGGMGCNYFPGYGSGTLKCKQDCTFDLSSCNTQNCGNGIKEYPEECDGTDFGGKTCASYGYTGGTLSCSIMCVPMMGGCINTTVVPQGNGYTWIHNKYDTAKTCSQVCADHGTTFAAGKCYAKDSSSYPKLCSLARATYCADYTEGMLISKDYSTACCCKGTNFGGCTATVGDNPYVKGTANDGKGTVRTDYCSDSSTIVDYHCDTWGQVSSFNSYKCPNGCVDGVCKNATTTTCTDTDNSPDYATYPSLVKYPLSPSTNPDFFVKGTSKGIYAGSTAGTYSTYYDHCGSSTQLNEYFCATSGKLNAVGVMCPNGCLDGVCKNATATTCSDTDGGKDYYLKGTATDYRGSKADFCIEGTTNVLVEYSCVGSQWTGEQYICPNGCRDGACIKSDEYPYLDLLTRTTGKLLHINADATPTCGNWDTSWCKSTNPSASGTGPYEFKWGDGYVTCSSFPAEHTYSSAGAYTAKVRVKNTCGLISERSKAVTITNCVPDATAMVDFRLYSSTDPSKSVSGYLELVQTRTYSMGGFEFEVNLVFVDPDKPSAKLQVNGVLTKEMQKGATNSLGSVGGMTVMVAVDSIMSSPGNGAVDFTLENIQTGSKVSGKLTDKQAQSYVMDGREFEVKALFINGPTNPSAKLSLNGMSTSEIKQGSSQTLDGIYKLTVTNVWVCTMPAQQTCTDSDGGKNTNVKGYIVHNGVTYWDKCYDSNTGAEVEKSLMLLEMYCPTSQSGAQAQITCPNGCLNGACDTNVYDCTDSDKGKDYYMKGTATGMENGQKVTSTDNCRYDGKTLAEVYCDGNDLKVEQYTCPASCINGACEKPAMYVATDKSEYYLDEMVRIIPHIPSYMDCSQYLIVPSGNIIRLGSGGCSPGSDTNAFRYGFYSQETGYAKVKLVVNFHETPDTKFTLVSAPFLVKADTTTQCTSNADCPLISQPAPGYKECVNSSRCSVSGGYNCINGKCVLSRAYTDCEYCHYGCNGGACVQSDDEAPELPKEPAPEINPSPICSNIGTEKEGWYMDGKLVRYAKCSCVAECKYLGTEKEGYYNSCTGEVIVYATCANQASLGSQIEVTIKNKQVQIEQNTDEGVVEITSASEVATTAEKLRIEEGKLSLVTEQGLKEINYLPDDVKQELLNEYGSRLREIKGIQLIEVDGKPVYAVKGKIREYLLWIIPISWTRTLNVDAGTNELI
ncbi:PKD domain-containing protein [Candidatus Woesearchaeota archaeon]|nr:PKD domain-containing protein [Candidatus Woesearchaeota archaeon]